MDEPEIFPVRWYYESVGGPHDALSVKFCHDASAACTPTEALPSRRLRLPCQDDECALQCPCDSGDDGTCDDDDDCTAPSVCIQGNGPRYGKSPGESVCEDPICETMPTLLGCGFEGAPCGKHCTSHTPCSEGCPAGQVCGVGKGPLFGDVVQDVCWDEICPPDPVAAGCGTVLSICGICSCEPSCVGKVCGDDPSDGCGGYCAGLCGAREPGCTADADCPAGFACLVGGGPQVGEPEGTNVCLPRKCDEPDVQAPDCGTVDSECGLCPTCEPECDGRECGVDPKCGVTCGSGCAAGEYCTDTGQCESSASDNDDPITVDDGSGGTRDITPPAPPPANDVGATPGSFSVDALGNATYAVPIDVPPGRAGMEPQLAVRYSSAAGNGLLGVGWSLEGLSVIARCSRTFARDGAPEGVHNDATDAYCLDGQRLVPISGSIDDPQREFRTDIDSFAKIVSYGAGGTGPASFKVWTKDGRIMSYGGTKNSRAYFAAQSGGVRAWALSRIEDRAGNRVDIKYDKPGEFFSTPQMVPERFSYGGNGTLEHDRSVHLVYEKRPDTRDGYAPGGTRFVSSLRLQRIDTAVRGVVTRSYNLDYDQAPFGDVSRLTSLQECLPPSGEPTCKPATRFGYHSESPAFTSDPQNDSFQVALLPGIVFDPDGDGDQDLKSSGLWYNGGYNTLLGPEAAFGVKVTSSVALAAAGYGAVSSFSNAMIDAMNDALVKDDWKYIPPYLYRATGDPSNPIVNEGASEDNTCIDENYTLRNGAKPLRAAVDVEGDGKDEVRVLCDWNNEDECEAIDPSYRRPHHSAPRPTAYPEWVVDLNGDGLADHVRCAQVLDEDGDGRMFLGLRSSASADIEPPFIGIDVPRAICLPACASVAKQHLTLYLDVDGDGVDNLVFFDGGWEASSTTRGGLPRGQPATGWQALVYSSGTAELIPVPGIPAPSSTYDILAADINGDGLRDVVKLAKDASSDPVSVTLNTGRGFVTRSFDQAPGGFLAVAGSYRSWAYDYDHDGRDDILHPLITNPSNEDGYWLRLRLGGEGNQQLSTTKLNMPEFPMPHLTADINGDGNMDIVGALGRTVLRIYYGHGIKNNLLTTVVDGADRRVDIDYSVETLDDPECTAEWPIQCLPRSRRPLVRSYGESHALNPGALGIPDPPEHLHVYGYYSPRVGLGGHGWQGFSKVIMDDWRCGGTSLTCSDGVLMSSTLLEYEPVTPIEVPGGTVYPLAGKLQRRFVRTLPERSVIEDPGTEGLYDRTQTVFDWQIGTSADGRPFPYVSTMTATTSVGDFLDPDSGELVSSTTTTNQVDGYGNVVYSTQSGAGYLTRSMVLYPADRDNWLVALPQLVTTTSNRNYDTKVRQTAYTFDGGLLESVTIQPNGPERPLTTTLSRDEFNNVSLITKTDTEGHLRQQSFEYDDRGLFPLVTYDSLLHPTQYRYDERTGQVTLMVDPNGIETKLAYDGFGRLREVFGPEGHVTMDFAEAFNVPGFALSTRASYKVVRTVNGFPDGETEYDGFGRVARTLTQGYEGQTVITENVYRGGLLFRRSRPHLQSQDQGYTEYHYDAENRLTEVVHPDGHTEQRLYANSASIAGEHSDWTAAFDATSVVASVTPKGTMDVLVTDQRNNPLLAFDALNHRTDYRLGAFDTPTGITDAEGNNTFIASDNLSRTTGLDDPARGINYFTYSAFGETDTHTDGNGALHQYFYDDLGRLDHIQDADGVTQFAYDGLGPNEIGRLVSATSPDGHTTELTYQPPEANRNRGLLESISRSFDGQVFTESVEYDDLSRIVARHYPAAVGSEFGISYHYNPDHGYLEAIRNAASDDPYWTYLSSYQGYRIESDELGNGTQTQRAFHPLTGLLQRIQTVSQGTPIHDVSYTYDDNYNVETRTDELGTRGTDTFVNDALDRLTFLTKDRSGLPQETIDYNHDAIGNITSQSSLGSYSYNDSSSGEGDGYELLFAGPNGYAHDDNGTMVSREGSNVRNFTQNILPNALDLPASISMPSVDQTIDFKYSAFGERIAKIGPASASGITLYAGDYRREQPDPSINHYLHHYKIFAQGRQIAELTRSETDGTLTEEWTQYLHQDLLGSVEVITDEAGEVVHTQQFDPYGNTDNPGWALTGILTGFTGHQHDPDLGLINMKGRIYDPAIARFLSADPFIQDPLFSQGLNRYSYGMNNPMSGSDPSGFGWLANISVGDAVGAAVIAGHAVSYGILLGNSDSLAGASPTSAGSITTGSIAGGGLGVGQAAYGLATSGNGGNAAPTGELGGGAQQATGNGLSQGGGMLAKTGGGQAPRYEAPPFDPGVKAGVEYAINRSLYGRKAGRSSQRAAEAALAFWHVKVNDIFLDSALPRIAETAYYDNGAVSITFNPAHFGSARWLLSTAFHEGVVHVQQYRSGAFVSYPKTGFWVNELEAIFGEQQLAPRLGLSAREVEQLQSLWDEAYQHIAGTPYQKRVDAGNFDVY